jgi:hypothetical protein
MLEDLAQIAAIDPAATYRTLNEVPGLIRWRVAKTLPEIFTAGDHLPQSSSASRFTAGASGFLNLSQSGERPER